jgi:hypothetical protein
LLAAAFPLSRDRRLSEKQPAAKKKEKKTREKLFIRRNCWFGRGRKLQPERWQERIVIGMNVSFFESDAGV